MLLFLVLVVPFVLLSIWASSRVQGTFAKWSKVPIRSGYSGADAARAILDSAGLHDVAIEAVPGLLSDHYDPRARVVRLSESVLTSRSVGAVAVAAHEVGHALQHAQAYRPMEWRSAIVPAVNAVSQTVMPMLLFGLIFALPGLLYLGVIAFGAAVLFHLVTLPVEFDASHRAIRILEHSGIANAQEMVGVRKTLYAAGFTYLAATLVAVAQLLMFLLPLLGGGGDD